MIFGLNRINVGMIIFCNILKNGKLVGSIANQSIIQVFVIRMQRLDNLISKS